jgi:hypothetical protein
VSSTRLLYPADDQPALVRPADDHDPVPAIPTGPRMIRAEAHPDRLVLTADGRARPRTGVRRITMQDTADPWYSGRRGIVRPHASVAVPSASRSLARAVSERPELTITAREEIRRMSRNINDIARQIARLPGTHPQARKLKALRDRQIERLHLIATVAAQVWRDGQDRPATSGPRYIRPEGQYERPQRRRTTRHVPVEP